MKIKLFVILVISGILSYAKAQEYADYTVQWPEKHVQVGEFCPLQVARLSNWAPDYLTVTDNYYNWLFYKAPTTLGVMCVITEVNGKSTKDMTPRDFYGIMYEATSVTLKYLRKENGRNVQYYETVTKAKGYGLAEIWGRDLDRNWTLTDEDVDFFEFNTFDFVINDGVNPLEQKQLLKEFAAVLEKKGLVRSTENPDIYLYVTLNSNENIESVYQPRTITQTNSNTYGNANVYSYSRNNKRFSDVDVRTNSSTSTRTTTTDVGTMRTYVSTDAYLELTILDAKRTNQSSVPKIWQFKYEGRVEGTVSLSTYESWISNYAKVYPFGSNSKYRPKYHTGRNDENKSSFYGIYVYRGEVSAVLSNSFANKFGINVGDKLELTGGKVKRNSVLIKSGNKYKIINKIGNTKIKASMFEPLYLIENGFLADW